MRGISRSGDWTWQERLNIKVARGDLLLFSVQSCENVRISRRRSHFFCLSDASNSSFPILGIILEAKQKEDVHFVCFILSSSKHYKHKHQSIISIVHCSQGFKILLMDDANSCGVNTWRLEDNDDWLMNCMNHVLASLTHSIFPLLSGRFSCSAHNDPRVGGRALNHIKQPQITARSSNPCSTRWERHQIIQLSYGINYDDFTGVTTQRREPKKTEGGGVVFTWKAKSVSLSVAQFVNP